MLKRKNITEMNINDIIIIEFGCYGNYTEAIIKDIRPTEYEHIKIIDYTIPRYTQDQIHTDRAVYVEVREGWSLLFLITVFGSNLGWVGGYKKVCENFNKPKWLVKSYYSDSRCVIIKTMKER